MKKQIMENKNSAISKIKKKPPVRKAKMKILLARKNK